MTDAEKLAMKEATQDAASVLIDDLQYIRALVEQEQPDAGDIRRLSAQLRRIIVEGDLRKIAAPRTGKIEIQAPDLRAIYRANDDKPFAFVAADEFSTHGLQLGTLTMEHGSGARTIPGYQPGARVPLRTEVFQNQRVLCLNGNWVSRGDIIKYVANVAHGVHSGEPKESAHLLVRQIRHAMTIEMINASPGPGIPPLDMPKINFDHQPVFSPEDPPLQPNPKNLDVALIHLLSTAQLIVLSPDVILLEKAIAEDG